MIIYKCILYISVDLLADPNFNDESTNEKQPVHGNKISKKNKKKLKNQDLEDESEGII